MTTKKTQMIERALDKATIDFHNAKALLADISNEYKEAQQDLLKALGKEGKHSIDIDGDKVTVTGVYGTRLNWDLEGLEAAVGPAMWKKCLRPVFDKELLEAAVASGKIDAEVVEQNTELVETAAYVRHTVRTGDGAAVKKTVVVRKKRVASKAAPTRNKK